MTIQGDWDAGYIGYLIEKDATDTTRQLGNDRGHDRIAIPGQDVQLDITDKWSYKTHWTVGNGRNPQRRTTGKHWAEAKLSYEFANDYYGATEALTNSRLALALFDFTGPSAAGVITPENDPVSMILEQKYGSIYRFFNRAVIDEYVMSFVENEQIKVEETLLGYFAKNAGAGGTLPATVFGTESKNTTGGCSIVPDDATLATYKINSAKFRIKNNVNLHWGANASGTDYPTKVSAGKREISLDVMFVEEGDQVYIDRDTAVQWTITIEVGTHDIAIVLPGCKLTTDYPFKTSSDMAERTGNYTWVPFGTPTYTVSY